MVVAPPFQPIRGSFVWWDPSSIISFHDFSFALPDCIAVLEGLNILAFIPLIYPSRLIRGAYRSGLLSLKIPQVLLNDSASSKFIIAKSTSHVPPTIYDVRRIGIKIKEPLKIDYENDSIESIVEKIEFAIEQHPSFLKVISNEDLSDLEKLQREFTQFRKLVTMQMASIGGGGEVRLLNLDDVDTSSLGNGKFLVFNSTTQKLEFTDQIDGN